ncbi:alpha/beta hydrolase [Candidatus Aerophobetes bacterium]|uniref:Alpha/beta hydrolase n=1 Tax=Aerophobetes bacterium TaxID=2030807 RepID=A0A2A4X452_UNCAE|nr:MAG: alpha/beta hydrolase [Candidatus Aerophobetes bacterium]
MKKLYKIFLPILIVIPVFYITAFYFFQEKLIFKAVKLQHEHVYNYNVPFKELFLTPEPGVEINALHFQAKDPKGMVVYYHGQGGNLANRWDKVSRKFTDAGYDFFIMDYRTFGKSTGVLSEKALLDDASYIYKYCMQFFEEKDLIVYGCSLGTGIASFIGATYQPKKVILESPYFSMVQLAQHTASYLPKAVIPLILKYHLRSDLWIEQISSSLLILHGTADKTIPYHMGKKLYEKSSQLPGNVVLTTLEAADHDEIASHPHTLQSLETHLLD